MSVRGRGAVIITGASSGIGRDATIALARCGWFVFAGVRTADDCQRVVANAGAHGLGEAIEPVLVDVTDNEQIEQSKQHVENILRRRHLNLVGLINNAGIAAVGPIEEVPSERLREVLETNVLGVAAILQHYLPLLRAGRSRIINMSSVSGRVAAPFLGPYAASKFALEALSDSLRVELRPWGLPVILIEPGPIDTPIWEKGDAAALVDRTGRDATSPYFAQVPRVRAALRRAGEHGLPVERVSATIIVALTAPHPRARYVLARNPYRFAFFVRFLPDSLRDYLFSRAF